VEKHPPFPSLSCLIHLLQMVDAGRKRLHITPFNADLLSRLVPVELASGVSFHSVQTFPEHEFGFVDLPAMEAERIKGKFHGTVLRGVKVRVEDARPLEEREGREGEEQGSERRQRKKGREQGVLDGYELEGARRVKRGWVEEGKEKARKTGGTGGEEEEVQRRKLRFRTTVPPNALPVPEKPKDGKKGREKRSDVKTRSKTAPVVVEEFARSKKPVAAEMSTTTMMRRKGIVASFEEGKGWVDDEGNIIEPAPASTRPKRIKTAPPAKEKSDILLPSEAANDSPINTQQASSDSNSSTSASEISSSSPSSSSSSSSAESSPDSAPEYQDPTTSTPPQKPVHPLEALFKRPAAPESAGGKPRPQRIDTSFSFFSSSGGDDTGVAAPPQTPHTRADLEWRAMRSAAPTPDTAAIGRTFRFPFADEDDEEEEREDEDVGMEEANEEGTGGGRAEESEFRRWFYENRGDLNRGWKKRRREEKKAKRQRENRRVSRRVA